MGEMKLKGRMLGGPRPRKRAAGRSVHPQGGPHPSERPVADGAGAKRIGWQKASKGAALRFAGEGEGVGLYRDGAHGYEVPRGLRLIALDHGPCMPAIERDAPRRDRMSVFHAAWDGKLWSIEAPWTRTLAGRWWLHGGCDHASDGSPVRPWASPSGCVLRSHASLCLRDLVSGGVRWG